MKYRVEFNIDNAAFFNEDEEFNVSEVVWVLKRLIITITESHCTGDHILKDSNGNVIGITQVIDTASTADERDL